MEPSEDPTHREPLKMHLRVVTVHGYTYRVLMLRPQTDVIFSTNFFHETWHILTDSGGAHILARLLWGLSFQRAPGTLIMIDRPHLVETPFEADPADRIVLSLPSTSTSDLDLLRALGAALRRGHPSDATVRLQTFGLAGAVKEWNTQNWRVAKRRPEVHKAEQQRFHERMDRRGGMICYSAPPEILRQEAKCIHEMGSSRWGDYHYMVERRGFHTPDGEVQVFSDFRDRVSAANTARREIADELRVGPGTTLAGLIADESLRYTIQRRAEDVKRRMHQRRDKSTNTNNSNNSADDN